MQTTLQAIKDNQPCTEGWTKLRKSIGTRKPLATVVTLQQILDSNGLDDAIWALRAFPDYEREVRLFACSCVCHVVHLNSDVRVVRAIECSALFAEGLADEQELSAASSAARAASRDAAWDDAGAAAGDAAWAAARAAARDAARAAARAAASYAAGAAERAWQLQELLKLCQGNGIYARQED